MVCAILGTCAVARGQSVVGRFTNTPTPERYEHSQMHPQLVKKWLARLAAQGLVPKRAEMGLQGTPTVEPTSSSSGEPNPLPSIGNVKSLTLLVEFAEVPAWSSREAIHSKIYGDGDGNFPYESVRAYYSRSSYGKLNLVGTTLGWYRLKGTFEYYKSLPFPDLAMAIEALTYYASTEGGSLRFADFDTDGDGYLDGINIIHSGPSTRSQGLWDGGSGSFGQSSFTVDGKRMGNYTFEWEGAAGQFDVPTVIHETGHMLGLRDYYETSFLDDGVFGGIWHDMMGGDVSGDHNAFSKWLLGWIDPVIVSSGLSTYTLNPLSGPSPVNVACAIFPDFDGRPFSEFFLVENAQRTGNRSPINWGLAPDMLSDGLIIWHVDAEWRYDNQNGPRKLIRMMQADGQDDIETTSGRFMYTADTGDFWTDGQAFSASSFPNSNSYEGQATGVTVKDISTAGEVVTATMGFERPLASPPVMLGPSVVIGFVDKLFECPIRALGGPTWFSTSGLPAGLRMDQVGGMISGVPLVAGTYVTRVTATNESGAGWLDVRIRILAEFPPDTLRPNDVEPAATAVLNTPFNFSLGGTNDPDRYRLYSPLPPGLHLDQDTGIVSGIPTQAGWYYMNFDAWNISGPGRGVLLILVQDKAPDLVMVPATVTAQELGGSGTIAVTADDWRTVWTVRSQAPWIHTSSAGSRMGDGSIEYVVDQNLTGFPRSGTIAIGVQRFTVEQATGTTPAAPSVTAHPSSMTMAVGPTALFTAGARGMPTPTVQWQVRTIGGSSWSDIAGATSTTHSFVAALEDSGNQYRAVFTNASGSATTDAATLTVTVVVAPAITMHPSSQAVTGGATTSFTAGASGTPTPTLQWQVSTNGGATWTNLFDDSPYSGATSPTLTVTWTTLSLDWAKYRAVATNGVGAAAASNAATLTVTESRDVVIFSNYGPNDVLSEGVFGIGGQLSEGPYYRAMSFTPAVECLLETLRLALGASPGNLGPRELDVALASDQAGVPGAVLETYHLSDLSAPSVYPFVGLVVHSSLYPLLSAGQRYWITVQATFPNQTSAGWWINVQSQQGLMGWHAGVGTRWVTGTDPMGAFVVKGIPTGTAVPTRVIGLSGSLAFGSVTVNTTATRTLTISNTGNATLTVIDIAYPAGFTGAWSGTIAAGDSQPVTVTFAPSAATNYSGTVTVNANQTSGTNTLVASGNGTITPVAFRRYFAEGAATTFFDCYFALANPNPTTAANVTLYFLRNDSQTFSYTVQVPAMSRRTVNAKDVSGLAPAFGFSTILEADVEVVADRTMTWDATGYGSHAETSIAAPAQTWYLAEGATQNGFQLYYLIENPNPDPVDVQVSYLRRSPNAPIDIVYRAIAGYSRTTIYVNGEDPRLAWGDVSAVLTSLTPDRPIIVERAMYLDNNGVMFNAGHDSAGVTAPATDWFLAEGATVGTFDMYILLANPGDTAGTATVTYMLTDGRTLVKSYPVEARSRQTVWVNGERDDANPAFTLSHVSLSAMVHGSVPIIVERSMWWAAVPNGPWIEATNAVGTTETGTMWAVADGEQGGSRSTDTYVLVANTSTFPGRVRVTLLCEDGTNPSTDIDVPANSRTTVWMGGTTVGPDSRFGGLLAGTRFGAVVESLPGNDGTAQIVVERAMYSNANGVTWAAGTDVVATKLK